MATISTVNNKVNTKKRVAIKLQSVSLWSNCVRNKSHKCSLLTDLTVINVRISPSRYQRNKSGRPVSNCNFMFWICVSVIFKTHCSFGIHSYVSALQFCTWKCGMSTHSGYRWTPQHNLHKAKNMRCPDSMDTTGLTPISVLCSFVPTYGPCVWHIH